MKTARIITINGRAIIGYHYAPPSSLEEAVALVHQERDMRKRASGYSVGEYWFHSDIESKIEQIGLLLLGDDIPPGLMWKTMGGVEVAMTPQLARSLFLAGVSSTASKFAAAKQHVAHIEANGWEGHDFFTGWPPAYWDLAPAS